MKIRTGFVSNSSSSSYVCDVTGEAFEVQDGCFWDAGLAQCKIGHVFQKQFLVPWKPEYPSHAEMLAKLDSVTDSKRLCETYRTLTLPELKVAYDKVMKTDCQTYESNVNQCPICTMKQMKSSELLDYMLKTSQNTRQGLTNRIHNEFGSYEAFQRFLKSN